MHEQGWSLLLSSGRQRGPCPRVLGLGKRWWAPAACLPHSSFQGGSQSWAVGAEA
jgi:hypothetical protein